MISIMKSTHFENQFFAVAIILFALLAGLIFLPELSVIVLGVSLAVLFEPWYVYLKKVFHGHGGPAAGAIVLLSIGLIFIPFIFFGFKIFIEAQNLYTYLLSGGASPMMDSLRNSIHKVAPSLTIDFNSYAQQAVGLLISNLGSIFSSVLKALATIFLSFFAFYYFLKDGPSLAPKIVKWSPLPQERTEEIMNKFYDITTSVVRGSILVGVIYGIFVGLGFFIFGVQSAILWGAITVVASFIPGIGVLLIVVPAIISLALGGHTIAAVGLTVWTFLMAVSVENIARPRLVGRRANVHPLLMLFAVLGGLSFFGPTGILLGPIVLSLFLTLLEIAPSFKV